MLVTKQISFVFYSFDLVTKIILMMMMMMMMLTTTTMLMIIMIMMTTMVMVIMTTTTLIYCYSIDRLTYRLPQPKTLVDIIFRLNNY